MFLYLFEFFSVNVIYTKKTAFLLSMPLYDSASFCLVRATGEFATIASVIQVLFIYFSTKLVDLSTRFTGVKDLRILCCENFFITENAEWVSFIIIAQSFHDLISKVHSPRGLHECWK